MLRRCAQLMTFMLTWDIQTIKTKKDDDICCNWDLNYNKSVPVLVFTEKPYPAKYIMVILPKLLLNNMNQTNIYDSYSSLRYNKANQK